MKRLELREEITLELTHLQQTVEDATALPEKMAGDPFNVYRRAAAGMLVAQFYNGVENILKRI